MQLVPDDLFVSPCAQLSGLLVDAQEEGQARCITKLWAFIHSSAAHELPVVRDSDPCAFRDLLSV